MMHVPPSPEAALETVQALLSRERVEFQSHDWAASVESESQLTLVEFLPTVAPLSLAHTFACACGGYQLCSARHEGTQHRPSSLLPPSSSSPHKHTDVTPLCFLMICPTLPLQSETMNGLEKWGPTQVCSPPWRIQQEDPWMGECLRTETTSQRKIMLYLSLKFHFSQYSLDALEAFTFYSTEEYSRAFNYSA